MTASLSLRVYTGTGAGTESAAQTGIAFMDIDSAANDPDSNQVAPGANSFEKWLRLRVESADDQTVSGFWVERTGDLPDGVTVKLGISAAPATPVATESTIASKTMHAGQKYYFDAAAYSSAGDHSSYLVLQEIVAADAASGQIDQQLVEFGWSAQ